MNPRTLSVAVLPGDGVGPEVIREAVRTLSAVCAAGDIRLSLSEHPVGGDAIDRHDTPLPENTLAACLAADAVLLGAVGGPRWQDRPPSDTPEAGLLLLRKALGTFANLRPVRVMDGIAGSSPLKAERVRDVDLLVVRELTGGIYYGSSRRYDVEGVPAAENVMAYDAREIERIAAVAFRAAGHRRGRVLSVDKANVLEVSRLWRSIVSQIGRDHYPEVDLTHGYVDSVAMRMVQEPAEFDVILTENLFGDILSDLAAVLPGSIGLLPSASIGGRVGLFEPVHGSAPDRAGTDTANPSGAILSAAMLLDECGHARLGRAVREAVEATLTAGIRTPDLNPLEGRGHAGTEELGRSISALAATLAESQTAEPA